MAKFLLTGSNSMSSKEFSMMRMFYKNLTSTRTNILKN